MTVVFIVAALLLWLTGIITGADIPQAMDDYAVLIIALAIVTSAFDIGYTIREAIRDVTGYTKGVKKARIVNSEDDNG